MATDLAQRRLATYAGVQTMLLCAVLLCATEANAEGTWAAGPIVGGSLSSSAYFPTWFAGVEGDVDVRVIPRTSVGLKLRVQLYTHPEDEDFGSWGAQEDISVALLFSLVDSREVVLRLVGYVGGALVQRIPFSDDSSSEIITGYIVGAGVELTLPSKALGFARFRITFETPSFTTHDDSLGRASELSLGAGVETKW